MWGEKNHWTWVDKAPIETCHQTPLRGHQTPQWMTCYHRLPQLSSEHPASSNQTCQLSSQHIKSREFWQWRKKKPILRKMGWNLRMVDGWREWPVWHEEIGRRQCGGGVGDQRRRNPSKPPELSSFFVYNVCCWLFLSF